MVHTVWALNQYDLSALGWLLFEQLCTQLLERTAAPEQAWTGRADRFRHVVVDGGLERVDPSLVGPTVVATGWVHPGNAPDVAVQAASAYRAAAPTSERRIRSLLVLTNLPAAAVRSSRDPLPTTTDGGVALGAEEIGELIDGDPELCLASPFLLGVREGGPGLDPEALERSHFDLDGALALAQVFVPTSPYSRALAVLREHRFCVLTGPPEMGKTAAARMVGLALMADGWEVHECTRPDEVAERLRPDRRQLFVADDAFGSTEYRPDAGERWARALPEILRNTDERHWLIWTSRPTPLKAALGAIHRERGGEHFPEPGQVRVDAADLDIAEKALILLRHAKAAGLGERGLEIVRDQRSSIVEHRHFTPERIRRFVQGRLPQLADGSDSPRQVERAVEREIEHPTGAMAASFLALSPSQRAVLVAMLDCPPGVVAERDLAAAARRHSATGLDQAPFDLVDRLTDHFLRLPTQTSVTWVHPSWRDLVIAQLAGDAGARRLFLSRCGHHGALLALSTAGGATGARRLPLLHDDADWDALGDSLARLIHECDERSLAELLLAIATALETCGDDDRLRAELSSLGAIALEFAELVHPLATPVGVGLIEGWLGLAGLLPHEPPPPWLPATWADLRPFHPPDPASADELARYEEWLDLVAAVRRHRHDMAVQFAFPGEQAGVLRRFAEAARPVLEHHPESPRAVRLSRLVLRAEQLLGRCDPSVVQRASAVVAELQGAELAETAETRARDLMAAGRDHNLVDRVLRDLTPEEKPQKAGR